MQRVSALYPPHRDTVQPRRARRQGSSKAVAVHGRDLLGSQREKSLRGLLADVAIADDANGELRQCAQAHQRSGLPSVVGLVVQSGQHTACQEQCAHHHPFGDGHGASTFGAGDAEIGVVIVGAVGELVGARRKELDPSQTRQANAVRWQLCRLEVDGRLVEDVFGDGSPLVAEIAVDLQRREVSLQVVQLVVQTDRWGAFPRREEDGICWLPLAI